MKILSNISTVLFLLVLYPLPILADTWANIYQGSRADYASSIQPTGDDGYIISGNTYVIDVETSKGLIIKLDNAGKIIWQKIYGGINSDMDDHILSIQATNDNGFIVAGWTDSLEADDQYLWIFKIDSAGNTIWQGTYGDLSDYTSVSIEPTSDGGYIIAANDRDDMPWEPWGNCLILKLDNHGNLIWQKTYNKANTILHASTIKETSDGGYIVAGRLLRDANIDWPDANDAVWILKLDGSGNVIWQNTYESDAHGHNANAIEETADGGYIIAGSIRNDINSDILLFKLDSNGNTIWQKAYVGDSASNDDKAVDMDKTSNGDYLVTLTGYANGLLLLDDSGNTVWSKKIVRQSGSDAISARETSDGSFVFIGDFDSHYYGGEHIGVVKLDRDGYMPDCTLPENVDLAPGKISLEKSSLGNESFDRDIKIGEFTVETRDYDAKISQICPGGGKNQVLSLDFNTKADGFYFIEGDLKDAYQSSDYAFGEWVPTEGYDASGGLHMALGGVDGVDILDGISGVWEKEVVIEDIPNAEIKLKYRLVTTAFDKDECAEVVVAIDHDVVEVLDRVCGGGHDTGWQTATFHYSFPQGAYILWLGAYINKKTGPREKADIYFDDLSIVKVDSPSKETICTDGQDNDGDTLIDCDDPDCSDSGDCESTVYLSEDFQQNNGVFQYQDDLFFQTRRGRYASGKWVDEGSSSSGGGLHLTLGDVNRSHVADGISGGWQANFSIPHRKNVVISYDYRLVTSRLDADECANVVMEVDSGYDTHRTERLCGRGIDTGWISDQTEIFLPSGEHQLKIGGFLNKKTGIREKADFYFDNVEVR